MKTHEQLGAEATRYAQAIAASYAFDSSCFADLSGAQRVEVARLLARLVRQAFITGAEAAHEGVH